MPWTCIVRSFASFGTTLAARVYEGGVAGGGSPPIRALPHRAARLNNVLTATDQGRRSRRARAGSRSKRLVWTDLPLEQRRWCACPPRSSRPRLRQPRTRQRAPGAIAYTSRVLRLRADERFVTRRLGATNGAPRLIGQELAASRYVRHRLPTPPAGTPHSQHRSTGAKYSGGRNDARCLNWTHAGDATSPSCASTRSGRPPSAKSPNQVDARCQTPRGERPASNRRAA